MKNPRLWAGVCVLGSFAVIAQTQAAPVEERKEVQWKTRLFAPDQGAQGEILLRCERPGSVTDLQTREDVARRHGLAGKRDQVERVIREMQQAGYETQGRAGEETLKIDLSFRLVFEKPIRFRIQVQGQGILVSRLPSDGKGEALVKNNVKQYLSSDKVAAIDASMEQLKSELTADLQAIYATWDERTLPFTESELRAIRLHRTGTVVRQASLEFCGKRYEVSLHASWENPLPEFGR